MGTMINAILGGAFIVLALFLTFLMYHLWGYPFDKKAHRSSAPRSLMNLHRALGYVFVAIYVVLMWDMVPRLWSYQVELPTRTVIHLTLGMIVGAILIVKIVIVRFFKHMESALAPFLGTALLICTLLLTGLALPYTLREAYLRTTAQDGGSFTSERIERVEKFLPMIGFDDAAGLSILASSEGLAHGREILMRKCTQCHDLRTILVKPRTPEDWKNTVNRMANRATVLNPIDASEQWSVTAYLIAISPTLQSSASDQRMQSQQSADNRTVARTAAFETPSNYDAQSALQTFETTCSQCHSPELIKGVTLNERLDAISLVQRMVSNGLSANEASLAQIVEYLAQTYVAE